MDRLSTFNQVWAVDFEFQQPAGERPTPLCLVARELRSGRLLRVWKHDLETATTPPYDIDDDALLVAYYASAELGCHLSLGWNMPVRILDLYAEFRCLTSGVRPPNGSGLLGALNYYGLNGIEASEKDSMRELVMRGGNYTADERQAVLNYCQSDVDALAKLLPAMLPMIDMPRALVRGRYMAAAARMERNGIPIDTKSLARFRAGWDTIQSRLIEKIDKGYGVFEGHTFKANRWAAWLASKGIPWPRRDTGSPALDDDTFRSMAKVHPDVAPIRELRNSLSKLRLQNLAVGSDRRNRCLISAFASKTGRNQPSNSKFIFGPSAWLRSLIKPDEGWAVAYVDYSQQEFGIGAALSGDSAMQDAYLCGDPYLRFAIQADAAPPNATKKTHPSVREQFKTCALGVQYGMSAESLARKLDECTARGRELLRLHHETYSTYWRWSDAIQDFAMLHGKLTAVLGWSVLVTKDANPRSLRNFPLQANGAEMLRLACCLATERGIRVAAPVHDALLIEAPVGEIEHAVTKTQKAMQEAGEIILNGFPLRSDAEIVRFPDRYVDQRGETMWKAVSELVGGVDAA